MNKINSIFSFSALPFACLLFIFFSLSANATTYIGQFKQGGLIIGQGDPGIEVYLDDNQVKVDETGRFVFGFGRDAGPVAILKIVFPNGNTSQSSFPIEKQVYDIERVDGLPPKTVNVPEEEKIRRQKETGLVRTARNTSTEALDWVKGFSLPAEGRISGVYGSQRILNGVPRWPHYGLVIAAPVGSEVKAPAGGVVRLAEPDFLLEGGIIILDHGFGVTSTLMHLSSVDVSVGQRVERGEVIAKLGATGRATGPHLDWRINWGSVRLDPALALNLDIGSF